jgi:cellulose synthase/poly-beta-1,6-N-acetylglucosamine synthase-like glycosyltransferase
MNIVSSAFIPILALYGGLLCYLVWALYASKRGRAAGDGKNISLPGVSVVIPFRNEGPHLPALIVSLDAQTYQGPLEIVLVNDGSTDDFRSALASCESRRPLKVIDADFSAKRGLTSKQQALDRGIRDAAYDVIALTDADMILEPCWLQTLLEPALRGADLVFGHTAMHTGASPGVFTWFQSFQLETLFACAYALNRGGIMGSCMGNNLLLSRKVYLEAGGFDRIGYSITEDRELLAAFWKKRMRCVPTEPFAAGATTFPSRSMKGYYHQLLRWAYGGLGLKSNLSLLALLAGVQGVALALACAGLLNAPIAIFSLCNFALTWIFIACAFSRMRSKEHAVLFLPFFILLIVESMLLLFSFIIRQPITWKDRRV